MAVDQNRGFSDSYRRSEATHQGKVIYRSDVDPSKEALARRSLGFNSSGRKRFLLVKPFPLIPVSVWSD